MIQMRQDSHDLRKSMRLENIEELERFHFEAKGCIDEQQD